MDDETLAAMRAQASDLAGQLERITGAFTDLQRRVEAVSVTAESRDGQVRVTVGHDGTVRDLWLDSRIYHTPDAAELARTILDTITVAAQEARQRVKDICEPHVDGETLDVYASGDMKQAMERFRQRLPFVGE